jgi:hypothetical protein
MLQAFAEHGAIVSDKKPDQLMAGSDAPGASWQA